MNTHIGSDFDDFLAEVGILANTKEKAAAKVVNCLKELSKGTTLYIIAKASDGQYFTGLYPPKYEPKFVQAVGSFNCVIFTSVDEAMEVQATILTETKLLTVHINLEL